MDPASSEELRAKAAELRTEAFRLIDALDLLQSVRTAFGTVAVVGSVDLDLMVWADIDVYTRLEANEAQRFLALLPALYARAENQDFASVRANFNDEYRRPGNPYGRGLYCGMKILGPERGRVWKLDLWAWDDVTFEEKLSEHRRLAADLARVDRDLVLQIKEAVYRRPEYRDTLTSMDVYAFAIQGSGRTLHDFDRFIARKK
jgi:hypothetical protein